VFIVGHIRGTSRPEVFPIGESDNQNNQANKKRGFWEENITACLKSRDFKDGSTFINESRKLSVAQRIGEVDGCSFALKSLGGGQGAKPGLYAIPVLTPDRVEKRQNGRRMKKNGEPGFTLTGQDIHGVYDGFRIRRLTPTECERLQGFPDGWTSGISDSQRYKCLGNAVTVNVIKAIGMKLLVKSIRQYETYNTLG
jgi:DNA (cytosine-5)-methyltransferase 1